MSKRNEVETMLLQPKTHLLAVFFSVLVNILMRWFLRDYIFAVMTNPVLSDLNGVEITVKAPLY